MGIVSGAVLGEGGDVVGVIPHAMLAAGGEGERVSERSTPSVLVKLGEEGRERVSAASFYGAPIADPGLRWNGYEWLSQPLTIPMITDILVGRCGLDAPTQGRDGATFVRVYWTSRWVWHVRRGI